MRASRRWYRNSVTAIADPVPFYPGPQMTPAEVAVATAPTGRAATWVRTLYIAVGAAQIAAVAAAAVLVLQIVLSVAQDAQNTVEACRSGQAGCAATGASLNGPVLTLCVCLAIAVLGRPLRRRVASWMQRSALRDAQRRRAHLADRMVLVDNLPARSRWLLEVLEQLTQSLPARQGEQMLWDSARRLDAAAALEALDTPAADQLADALADQVEGDTALLRTATVEGHRYRHARCRTRSQQTLTRSTPAEMLAAADLLLPHLHAPQESAS